MRTESKDYTERLDRLSSAWWKRLIPVQAPYAWKIKRIVTGPTLEAGCGTGRMLRHLPAGSWGLDNNPHMVERCQVQGLQAVASDRAAETFNDGQFSSLLSAHVVEHMTHDQAVTLLKDCLPFLAPDATLVLITPQERGFASDPTHVSYTDADGLRAIASDSGFEPVQAQSFPLPAAFGKWFRYNEHIVLARRRADSTS